MTVMPDNWRHSYEQWLVQREELMRQQRGAEVYRSYPFATFADAPLTAPAKPLAQSTVALVTSGGLSLPGQTPFDESLPFGDPSVRWIAGAGPLAQWNIDHGHYDPAAAREDYNCVFPLDALRDLARERVVGSIAPRQLSFMGFQTDPEPFLNTLGPSIVEGLAADVALLVPV